MAENDLDFVDDRGGLGVGEDVIGDRPRRYQRRRPRNIVPDYVDWKDVDLLRQFVPERGNGWQDVVRGLVDASKYYDSSPWNYTAILPMVDRWFPN